MIRTLDDLVAFTEEDALRWPDLADEILLRSPGCSDREISALSTVLPDLPPIYLRCLARFDVRTFDIGYFSFAPSKFEGEFMLDRLTAVNSRDRPFFDLLTGNHLVEVGSYEGDAICVATCASAAPDEVYLLSLMCPSEPTLHRTAGNFEHLMLAAGRLRDVRSQGLRGEEPIEWFVQSLGDFNFDSEQLRQWQNFAVDTLTE